MKVFKTILAYVGTMAVLVGLNWFVAFIEATL